MQYGNVQWCFYSCKLSMIKKNYKINGMDCAACASIIELDLEDVGIKASCSYPKETLEVEFDGDKSTEDKIKKVIESGGYTMQSI